MLSVPSRSSRMIIFSASGSLILRPSSRNAATSSWGLILPAGDTRRGNVERTVHECKVHVNSEHYAHARTNTQSYRPGSDRYARTRRAVDALGTAWSGRTLCQQMNRPIEWASVRKSIGIDWLGATFHKTQLIHSEWLDCGHTLKIKSPIPVDICLFKDVLQECVAFVHLINKINNFIRKTHCLSPVWRDRQPVSLNIATRLTFAWEGLWRLHSRRAVSRSCRSMQPSWFASRRPKRSMALMRALSRSWLFGHSICAIANSAADCTEYKQQN